MASETVIRPIGKRGRYDRSANFHRTDLSTLKPINDGIFLATIFERSRFEKFNSQISNERDNSTINRVRQTLRSSAQVRIAIGFYSCKIESFAAYSWLRFLSQVDLKSLRVSLK